MSKDKIRVLQGRKIEVDTSRFKDELATRIGWGPLKKGGTNICTFNLVEDGSHRLRFTPTLQALLFYGLFAVLGIGVLLIVYLGDGQSKPVSDLWLPYLVGGVFSMVGVWLLISETVPKTFDKVSGFFFVGRKQPSRGVESGGNKNNVSALLSDIHAIQILPEYIHSSRSHRSRTSSYFSYELNLVLKDGKRVNVIDHGNRERIQKDGEKLASFLQVPCWDATHEALSDHPSR